MEPSIGIWAGVTGFLMLLSGLFGMRVEVRGISGIGQDVKDFLAKISQDIKNVKDEIEKIKNPAPVTPAVTVIPTPAA